MKITKTYTDEELIEILKKIYIEKGELDSLYFKAENGLPSRSAIIKRFGSWNKAKEKANIPHKEKRTIQITKELLINDFKNFITLNNGKIPTYHQLEISKDFKSQSYIYKHYSNYGDFVRACGFDNNKTNNGNYKKDFLISEIKRFVDEFQRTPVQNDFEKLKGYPSRKTFQNHFNTFNECIEMAGFIPVSLSFKELKKSYSDPKYREFLLNEIKRFITEYSHVPTIYEMEGIEGFPNRDRYRQVFGSWNKALIEAKLPLNSVVQYEDIFLESEFRRFVSENGRVPTYVEFNNSEYPSFWCYQNRFGSWNKAVENYGYKTYFEDYNIDNIKEGFIKLYNHILETENRDTICISDINTHDFTPTYCCCMKHFKLNNLNFRDFLKEINFKLGQGSCGMVYNFPDGERTVSKYEFDFSRLLRNNSLVYGVDYFRDVKYKTFVKNYDRNMNCDYAININNKIIYIEIVGFLRDYKKAYYNNKIITGKRKEEYRQKLGEKEQMFIDNNLEYHILFPSDLKDENNIISIITDNVK